MATTKIVIGCTPRTGSNLLQDSLAKHPSAIDAGEIFQIPIFRRPIVQRIVDQGRDPLAECNLFKVFSSHHTADGFQRLVDSADVLIYLFRINRRAQLESWQKACESGVWIAGQKNPYCVPFPSDTEEQIDRAGRLFGNRANYHLAYEHMINNWDVHIAAILQLAGWDPCPLAKVHQKQS